MSAVTTSAGPSTMGDLLRHWRVQRRLSQLELAVKADVSARHLSFVETGRSRASREMVLHLAEQLDVPLRERNAMLVAGGFAPVYRESSLDEPDLASVRHAISVMLENHAPMPALVVDRRWDMVDANAGAVLFLAFVPDSLLGPPLNVIRISLHPDGLAPNIVNFEEYAAHTVDRLRRQLAASGDRDLGALLEEVLTYPRVSDAVQGHRPPAGVVLPVQFRHPDGSVLSFFTTMTVFGAPLDITLAELAVESFFPADESTTTAVRAMVAGEAG